jgi:hypothetical protein
MYLDLWILKKKTFQNDQNKTFYQKQFHQYAQGHYIILILCYFILDDDVKISVYFYSLYLYLFFTI